MNFFITKTIYRVACSSAELFEMPRQETVVVQISPLSRALGDLASDENIVGNGLSCPGLRTHEPIESKDVRNHQHWNVDDGDEIGCAELAGQVRKADSNGVVVVDEDVGRAHKVVGDDEEPEQRASPHGKKCQNGEHAGREITVGGKRGEGSRKIWANDTGKNEDEP